MTISQQVKQIRLKKSRKKLLKIENPLNHLLCLIVKTFQREKQKKKIKLNY